MGPKSIQLRLKGTRISGYPLHEAAKFHEQALQQNQNLKDKLVEAEQKKQALLDLWAQGRAARDSLIAEAKLQGFNAEIVSSTALEEAADQNRPFAFAQMENGYAGAIADSIYCIKENIDQHGWGEGVFLLREGLCGYEFIGVDYGPGVIDLRHNPVSELIRIFEPDTSFGPGRRQGNATHYLARMTYLIRAVSVNGGKIRIVDKKPAINTCSPVPVAQADFVIEEEDEMPTGFIIHSYMLSRLPISDAFSFLPVDQGSILSPVLLRSKVGEEYFYDTEG